MLLTACATTSHILHCLYCLWKNVEPVPTLCSAAGSSTAIAKASVILLPKDLHIVLASLTFEANRHRHADSDLKQATKHTLMQIHKAACTCLGNGLHRPHTVCRVQSLARLSGAHVHNPMDGEPTRCACKSYAQLQFWQSLLAGKPSLVVPKEVTMTYCLMPKSLATFTSLIAALPSMREGAPKSSSFVSAAPMACTTCKCSPCWTAEGDRKGSCKA